MIKKDELKEGDFVVYIDHATFEEENGSKYPKVALALSKIISLSENKVDIINKKSLERSRITKVISKGELQDYEDYNEENFISEFLKGDEK
jgi:hypothetical protein